MRNCVFCFLVGCFVLLRLRHDRPSAENIVARTCWPSTKKKAEQERMFIDSLVASMHSAVCRIMWRRPRVCGFGHLTGSNNLEHHCPRRYRSVDRGVDVDGFHGLVTWTEEEPCAFFGTEATGQLVSRTGRLVGRWSARCVPGSVSYGLGSDGLSAAGSSGSGAFAEHSATKARLRRGWRSVMHIATWNALLDGMEEGSGQVMLIGFSHRVGGASPCMAWYETDDGLNLRTCQSCQRGNTYVSLDHRHGCA